MTSGRVRRWNAGATLIGGAVATAAALGLATAHADDGVTSTDPGSQALTAWADATASMQAQDPLTLLDTAATNTTDAIDVLDKMPNTVVVNIGPPPTEVFDQFEAIQTPLLTSHNSFLSGLGDFLFAGPDEQLEEASASLLTAAQALAADPSSLTADEGLSSAGLQYLDAVLIDSLLPNIVGKVIDQVFDIGDFDAATGGAAGADLATGFDLPF